MTFEKWLSLATKQLESAGIGTARLDAIILLEDTLGVDRVKLLANPTTKISADNITKLTNLLNRRAEHEPLAFIRGFTEFYGRKFIINQNVLEPRPESETMIDLLKDLVGSSKLPGTAKIGDVGTGSGALGITAKLELPDCTVELIDIDELALDVAKSNVDLLTPNVSVIKSDLLDDTTLVYDVLLCNLPYVPDDYQINSAAGYEPKLAIFGGTDGLDLYRKLYNQIDHLIYKPLYILTESLPPQHIELASIAFKHGYTVSTESDFIQVFERT